MVARIEDFGKYYADLYERAEQNKAKKKDERVRLANERAERERIKRETQSRKTQELLAKAMQKEIDEKKKLAQAKQEERIKELEKQWEKDRIFKTEETLKFESGIKSMLSKINKQ